MRDVDVIALTLWIVGITVNCAFYLFAHYKINAVVMAFCAGGLVFSAVATISTAIRETKSNNHPT